MIWEVLSVPVIAAIVVLGLLLARSLWAPPRDAFPLPDPPPPRGVAKPTPTPTPTPLEEWAAFKQNRNRRERADWQEQWVALTGGPTASSAVPSAPRRPAITGTDSRTGTTTPDPPQR